MAETHLSARSSEPGPWKNGASLQSRLSLVKLKFAPGCPAKTVLQDRAAGDRNRRMAREENHVRAHLMIHGRVQGVYFRAATVYEAQNLGLTGWVRNCADGSVEVVAEGLPGKLEELIAWCRQGPSGARVHAVDVTWLDSSGEFHDFRIKR